MPLADQPQSGQIIVVRVRETQRPNGHAFRAIHRQARVSQRRRAGRGLQRPGVTWGGVSPALNRKPFFGYSERHDETYHFTITAKMMISIRTVGTSFIIR